MSLPNGAPPLRSNIARKKPKIFYGWWIVITAVFLNIFQGGVLFYGFTLVFDPMTEEMNWSKTQVTATYPIIGLTIAVLAPFVGSLFDRIGPRPLIAVGMSVVGTGLIMLHSVDSLPMFYLWFSLANIGSMGMFLSVGPTVANWFFRRRGRALGIFSMGFALAGIIAPLLYVLIDGASWGGFQFGGVGWRNSFLIVGIIFLLLMPIAVFIFRHRPEDIGLYPDGAERPPLEASAAVEFSPDAEMNTTARQALRTQAFWLMAFGSAFTFLTIAALEVHWVPYLGSVGFSRESAAFFLPLLPLGTLLGRLSFGFLADLWDTKQVTALAFAFQAAAVLMLSQIDATREWTVYMFLIMWGVGFGGTVVSRMALQGYLFGRNSFGALQGMLSMTSEAGFAFSPLIASVVFESLGTYRPLFMAFATLALLAAPIILLIRRPRPVLPAFVPAAPSADALVEGEIESRAETREDR